MFLLHKWKWFRCCSWLYFFQLCSNTEQISQVLKTQKKLCKSHCCCSNQPLSKLYCYFAWYVLFKVTTFLFSAAVCPQWWSICVTYFVEHTCCLNVVNSKVGKQMKRCEINIHAYIKTKITFHQHVVKHWMAEITYTWITYLDSSIAYIILSFFLQSYKTAELQLLWISD